MPGKIKPPVSPGLSGFILARSEDRVKGVRPRPADRATHVDILRHRRSSVAQDVRDLQRGQPRFIQKRRHRLAEGEERHPGIAGPLAEGVPRTVANVAGLSRSPSRAKACPVTRDDLGR